MGKKSINKKLEIKKETVRELSNEELKDVVGGYSGSGSSYGDFSCRSGACTGTSSCTSGCTSDCAPIHTSGCTV